MHENLTRVNVTCGLVSSFLAPYIQCAPAHVVTRQPLKEIDLTNSTLLALKDVTARYGDVQVLWGVTFAVREAEIATLVGANGAGKSTTLKTISGVVRAAGGQIIFAGERIERLPPHEIAARGIAHVPEGRRLFPLMSVKENLDLGAVTREARRQRAESFDKVYALFPKLKEREAQMAGTLSGGEQQMLALSNALVLSPRLLLLDEPSLGLSPQLVAQTLQRIKNISLNSGTAVLIVEQKVRDLLAIADYVYVLRNGRVAFSGPAQDMHDETKLREAYL